MANRLKDDLRYIVGVDGLKGGIEPPKPKNQILGGRGISYFNADGGSETMSGNPPSDPTKKDDEEEPDGDEEDEAEEGTTQPGGGGGGGGDESPGGNSLDNTEIPEPTTPDEPSPNFDDIKKGGGSYGGIGDLVDCETGDCVSVRYDGQFSAPEGWDNPDSGPVPDDWEEGYYWNSGNDVANAANRGATGDEAAAKRLAQLEEPYDVIVNSSYSPSPPVVGNITYSITHITAPNGERTVYTTDQMNKYLCSGNTSDYCNPVALSWPEDKCTEVSYDAASGTFKTHAADTKVYPSMAGGVAVLPKLCSGSREIVHYPQADGTIAIYDQVSGIAKFLNPDGTVAGYGDGAAVTAGQP